MADKSGSDALITGLAVAAVVGGIYAVHMPTVAGARASGANNQHLESGRKSATYTAAAVVVGATALGKIGVGDGFASTVFIIGGTVVIALDFAHRLANQTDNQSGKLVMPQAAAMGTPGASDLMTWYVVKWDGQTYTEDLSGAAEKTLTLLGIHGYATEAEAQANPQTMNDLQAAAGGAQALAGVSGSATNIPTPGGVAAGTGQAASTASSLDSAVTGFLGDLTSRNLWLRIAKIVVGMALVIAGVVQLTHAQNVVGAAAKGAVLA